MVKSSTVCYVKRLVFDFPGSMERSWRNIQREVYTGRASKFQGRASKFQGRASKLDSALPPKKRNSLLNINTLTHFWWICWRIMEPFFLVTEGNDSNDPPFLLEGIVFFCKGITDHRSLLRKVPQIPTHHDFQQYGLTAYYTIYTGILGKPPFHSSKISSNDFH